MHICESSLVGDCQRISGVIGSKGWGEANGGNISIRIPPDELAAYAGSLTAAGPEIRLPHAMPELAGDGFLVTGAGAYFRNISTFPAESLGLIRINAQGNAYTLQWGLHGGGRPTSELAAHLLSHAVRKKASNGSDRVVLHTHATNLIALSFVLPLETTVITRELWEMLSECLILFPDGIGVLDWMLPGSEEIGQATARLMATHRLVLWAHHGIFGVGEELDSAFGLIETADKAAEILIKVMAAGGKKQAISPDQLRVLARAFGVQPLPGILN